MVRHGWDAYCHMPPPLAPTPGVALRHAGFSASRMFNSGVSYTYDDVIMLPGHINFGANEVGGPLSRRWWLPAHQSGG